jgi:hypothetical protein
MMRMGRSFAILAVATLLVVSACGDDDSAAATSPDPSGDPETALLEASPSPVPQPSVDPEGELCLVVADFEQRLAALRAVELTLPNRVALNIEFDKLQATFGELEDAEVGDFGDELEGSMTRLGYKIGELELAVEDFRTNSRTRRAAPHVEEDSQKVADELAALLILSRC